MATVNLGRIKPVFRGAYSGSTAYVIDDIVTHGNESFICIQAHGAGTQATSVTAYWTKLAAKGTDGTDVGTTITTQGDILYRDGSGLARLGFGTSGHVLTTKGTGANPAWEAAVGGKVLQVIFNSINTKVYLTNVGTTPTEVGSGALDVAITPSATSSKILLMFSSGAMGFDTNCGNLGYGKIMYKVDSGSYADVTPIGSGHPTHHIAVNLLATTHNADNTSFTTLHSPSSTGVLTYRPHFWGEGSNADFYMNRSTRNSTNDYHCVTTLTAMEIGA
jgi:hypothetical protein